MRADDGLSGKPDDKNIQKGTPPVEDSASLQHHPPEDDNTVWGGTILSLMKIIAKNKQQLAFFQNRVKQAQFMDRPNIRMVGTAQMHTDSLRDQITALELELMEIERLEGGGLLLLPAEELDLKWIWWWINEPAVQPFIRISFSSFDVFLEQWRAWMADDKTYPLSIRLATGELIGFLLMNCTEQTAILELIILRPDYRRRGYGPDAVRQAMRILFEQEAVNHNAVQPNVENQKTAKLLLVQVDPDYTAAVRCFEKAGLRSLVHDAEDEHGHDEGAGYELGIRREEWLHKDKPASDNTVWTSDNASGISLGDFANQGDGEQNAREE